MSEKNTFEPPLANRTKPSLDELPVGALVAWNCRAVMSGHRSSESAQIDTSLAYRASDDSETFV
jgi:hypothetical protein